MMTYTFPGELLHFQLVEEVPGLGAVGVGHRYGCESGGGGGGAPVVHHRLLVRPARQRLHHTHPLVHPCGALA